MATATVQQEVIDYLNNLEQNVSTTQTAVHDFSEAYKAYGNKFVKVFEKLDNILGKTCAIFGVVGAGISLIEAIFGSNMSNPLDSIQGKVQEISTKLDHDFQRLTNLFTQQIAYQNLTNNTKQLRSIHNIYINYKNNPDPIWKTNGNWEDLVHFNEDNISTEVMGLISLMGSNQNFFKNISGFYGNSPSIMLNEGMKIITYITNAITALVAAEKLKVDQTYNRAHPNENGGHATYFTSTTVTDQKKREKILEIIKNKTVVFYDHNTNQWLQNAIMIAMKNQINSFNLTSDVSNYFENYIRKDQSGNSKFLELKHQQNCEMVVNGLVEVYPSLIFFAAVTYHSPGDNYECGYFNADPNIKIIKFQDSALGSNWGAYYMLIAYGYNQTFMKNQDKYNTKCLIDITFSNEKGYSEGYWEFTRNLQTPLEVDGIQFLPGKNTSLFEFLTTDSYYNHMHHHSYENLTKLTRHGFLLIALEDLGDHGQIPGHAFGCITNSDEVGSYYYSILSHNPSLGGDIVSFWIAGTGPKSATF